MKTPLKDAIGRFLLFFGLSIWISLSFQNCGSPRPESTDLDTLPSTTCIEDNCDVESGEGLQISIRNTEPLRIVSAEKAFDVSGYCNTAGYAESRIYFQLKGPTPVNTTLAPAGCDALGRFRILVKLPVNFQYGTLHTLEVILRAIDDEGAEVDNPLGINKRELAISSTP